MKIAYFDCTAGASGDMLLGSVLDVLARRNLLEEWQLQMQGILKIEADGGVRTARVNRASCPALKVDFFIRHTHADQVSHGHAPHRHLRHIRAILKQERERGSIPDRALDLSEQIFLVLAEAEAIAHNCELEQVHFHEVGAFDSIMDVVGFSAALELLEVDEVWASKVMLGSGTVKTEHGLLEVPAPAVAEIRKAHPFPITGTQEDGECLTPTGAAVLAAAVKRWDPALGERPPAESGWGAGTRDPQHYPNVVQLGVYHGE